MPEINLFFFISLVIIWGLWSYRKYLRPHYRKKYLRNWLESYQQKEKTKKALKKLNGLYANVNTHRTAKIAKLKRRIKGESFVYGEIDFLAFIALLVHCKPKEGEVFYDLGSGAGKAVLCAAVCFPFKKSIGIELIPELVRLSKNRLALFRQSDNIQVNASDIQFIQADFLDVVLEDAGIVYINATAFRGPIWQKLRVKLMTLPIGVRVIITTLKLPENKFQLIFGGMTVMSWGMNSVYIYEKIT